MIISISRLKEWTKFLFLFILFTLLLYQMIAFCSPYFKPDIMNKEPTGGAVKVFAHQEVPPPRSAIQEIKNRLLIFYWLGE